MNRAYDPSPEEIERLAAEIRERWTDTERASRWRSRPLLPVAGADYAAIRSDARERLSEKLSRAFCTGRTPAAR